MEIQEKRLYTVGQAAELLSRSPESVRRMIRKGYLPGRNIGRRLYVLGADLLTAGTKPAPRDNRVVLKPLGHELPQNRNQ